MIEVVIILVLAGLLGWKEYSSRKERENYLDMLKAKDAADLATIKVARKTPPKPGSLQPPDLVPIEDIDMEDEDFQEAIKNERGE